MTAIFKTFGELSAVRLPRKMAGTGDHRFLDFGSLDLIQVCNVITF